MSMPTTPPETVGKAITILSTWLAAYGQMDEFDFRSAVVRGDEKEGGDNPDRPPFAIIAQQSVSDFPFGDGSGRVGLADYTLAVRCYGERKKTGARQARAFARQVRQAFHNRPPEILATVGLHRTRVISTGPVLSDPVEDIPYVPVIIGLYASSLEAAS